MVFLEEEGLDLIGSINARDCRACGNGIRWNAASSDASVAVLRSRGAWAR
jgi:hypothetical protein